MEKVDILKEIIENAGFEPRSYSGRGMFGEECVGFVCQNPLIACFLLGEQYLNFLLGKQDELEDKYNHTDWTLNSLVISQDNMGLETIVYFPRIKWKD